MSERQKFVLPTQLGDGYSLRWQSQGSPLLVMSPCATKYGAGAWWGGTAHGDTTWHPMAPHAQPGRRALTALRCFRPEQGQAALLGERDGQEGGLAERLARLWQRAHGHESLLHRIWARYNATVLGVPLTYSPIAPAPASLQPLAHQDPDVALCDTPKLQRDGRISSLRLDARKVSSSVSVL